MFHPFVLGLLLAFAQTAAVLALSGQSDIRAAYACLSCFDSRWYASIIEEGYHYQPELLTHPGYQANFGFFPGYPLATRAVMSVVPLPAELALPLTAQLACAGFWTYFLLLLRRRRVPASTATVGVLAVLLHPGAFFLVLGYSEALFVLLMLGFLFWSAAPGAGAWFLAALHGFGLTATRYVGLAMTGYPVVREWCGERRRMGWCIVLAGVACLGVVAFFAWCQAAFGRWDLYLRLNEIGWQTHADYFAVFRPESYRPAPLFGPDGAFCPDRFSRNFVPLTTLFFGGLLWREWRCERLRERVGLYVCAGLLFYLAIGGKAGNNMGSMLRIVLPVHVLLVLAAVHQHTSSETTALSARRKWLLAGGGAVALLMQAYLAYRFTHRLWVA